MFYMNSPCDKISLLVLIFFYLDIWPFLNEHDNFFWQDPSTNIKTLPLWPWPSLKFAIIGVVFVFQTHILFYSDIKQNFGENGDLNDKFLNEIFKGKDITTINKQLHSAIMCKVKDVNTYRVFNFLNEINMLVQDW